MRASAFLFVLLAFASDLTAQLTCGDATISARSLHYCTGGRGSSVVVFESPLGAGVSAWDSVVTRVALFARVITWDRAGTGNSPATTGPRTPADVAGDLRLLLNRLGERGRVVVVAAADGAWFARAFAKLYPHRVRALVLIEPPHEDFESRVRALLTPAELAARDSSLAANASQLPDEARREFTALQSTPVGEFPDVPLVVISAGLHDWIPREKASAMEALWQELDTALAGRVRDSRTRVVTAAGPDLLHSHPGVIADAVRDVLARSEPEGIKITGNFVMWFIGILISLGLGVAGARFNKMQVEKAEAEAKAAREKAQKIVVDPHKIGLFDLVPRETPPAGLATALLRAANREAAKQFEQHVRDGSKDARADLMWGRTWEEGDWMAQRAWVEPTEAGPDQSLVGDVLQMLRDGERRIWITAPAGAGKSTFLNRLFFEATRDAASGSLPVPMFVQPRNVGAQGVQLLRQSHDPFVEFLEGWLRNRSVVIPPEARDALISDFSRALEKGDIVLFVDGFDELDDLGVAPFLDDLLTRSACWVCAERSDRRFSRTGTSVELPRIWRLDKIRDYLNARWPKRADWAARVYEHLHTETDAHHILRVPRYLDLFLRRLEDDDRLPGEAELRELSRGGPELAADIVALALRRLPPDPGVREHDLNARLFQVAKARVLQADFVLPRAERDGIWARILQMTEFVSHVENEAGYNIRITHPALVDYFLAGQIAAEFRSGAPTITQGERHWSRGLLAGVSAWLWKSAGPGITREVWLRIAEAKNTQPVTNLLELVVQLDIDGQRNAWQRDGESDRRRNVTIEDRDLSRRMLESVELRLVTFQRCRFVGADLSEADLQHVTFHDCEFAGANLAGANALGADFVRCRFLDAGNPNLRPAVRGLQIEAAEFRQGTSDATDVDAAWLTKLGATQKRTRYGAEFGRIFFSRQAAFLGREAASLERGAYRDRIEAALGRCDAGSPITLVDLMAGGGNEWLAGLVKPNEQGAARFPRLRVLGIDRDEPQLRELKEKFPDVFKWHRLEIGAEGVDLPAIVGTNFVGPDQRLPADLIVAKKAIHELRQPLQRKLLTQCFEGIRPGGEFVLFADSPGPEEPAPYAMTQAEFDGIDGTIRELLLNPKTPLIDIRKAIIHDLSLGGSHADQARFCNLWVLVKDWANDNMHEVRNRWFSSAAEIRWWAREAGFTETSAFASARYRIAVARFNERGIQRVVHHLERNGPSVIVTDASLLADWLSAHGDERQALLLEFTAHHLTPGKELAHALSSNPEPTNWGMIHEDLRKLEGVGGDTIAFDFPVHVVSFQKP